MKYAWIGIIVLLVAFLAYRFVVPAAFVAFNRGPIDAETLSVGKVYATPTTLNDANVEVQARQGWKFVNIDVSIGAEFKAFDVYDFQLVATKADRLGDEKNLGDNLQDDYFYWTPLDSKGIPDPNGASGPTTRLRLTYLVPADKRSGYLFYWGEYFGPLEF